MGLEQEGRKARLMEKALPVGAEFPKQRCLPAAKELLLLPLTATKPDAEVMWVFSQVPSGTARSGCSAGVESPWGGF